MADVTHENGFEDFSVKLSEMIHEPRSSKILLQQMKMSHDNEIK